jgi:hypothetical protein
MEAAVEAPTAPTAPTAPSMTFRKFWKRYGGAICVGLASLGIFALYEWLSRAQRQSISSFFQTYRGGSVGGLEVGVVGLTLIIIAQCYTLVKRIGVPEYIRKLGGSGRWLTLHIFISLGGVILVLIHAGFPFSFRTSSLTSLGYAGLATWLLILTTISGVFGRYLYKHLPAFKRAFAVWKPTHLVVTFLFFIFAFLHVYILELGGGA